MNIQVGTAVYRRDRPMTYKGRIISCWWSEQSYSWHAQVKWPDGSSERVGIDKLIEVVRND